MSEIHKWLVACKLYGREGVQYFHMENLQHAMEFISRCHFQNTGKIQKDEITWYQIFRDITD